MKQLKFLDDLVQCFEKLPGVGHKTALRYAYYVVENYDFATHFIPKAFVEFFPTMGVSIPMSNDLCHFMK